MTTVHVVQCCLKPLAILLSRCRWRQPKTQVRILQSNAAGDRVHIIDPVPNKVVGEIQASRGPMASRRHPTEAGSTSVMRPTTRWTWPISRHGR